jgi:protein-histidine pros-kinase
MCSTEGDPTPTSPPVTAESVTPLPVSPRRRRDVAHQFATLIQFVPDATVVVDRGGNIRLVNRRLEELFGYSAKDLLGEPVDMLLAERLRAVHRQQRAAFAANPVPAVASLALSGQRRDGTEFPVEVSLGPLGAKREALVIISIRDITERQQARAEAEQLNLIFEGIADGLLVYNPQGQLVRINPEARRILGLDAVPPEDVQRPVYDRTTLYEARDEHGRILAPEEWPIIRVLSGQATGAVRRELQLRALDGRVVELVVSAAPLRDARGHLSGAVGILHDQTEQKRLAREREEARAHELALEDIARHMDEFLATASHDLRTPLTVVKSRVQMALRRATRLRERASTHPDALPDAEIEALYAGLLESNQSADRLTRFVTLLFDVARARSGNLELRLAPCDLAELVRRNAAAQQEAVPGRHIQVDVPEVVVPVEADADRLEQVLSNYLTNALKYSPADQPVTVKLVIVGELAVVSVEDHGPGLPMEEQSRIWEVFHRAPGIEVQPGNAEVSGSLGLGLHICKQVIELHPGGSVGFQSTIGEGSTFWFHLPVAQ